MSQLLGLVGFVLLGLLILLFFIGFLGAAVAVGESQDAIELLIVLGVLALTLMIDVALGDLAWQLWPHFADAWRR